MTTLRPDGQASNPPLRLGLIGFGDASRIVLESLKRSERFTLVGAADTDPVVRDRFVERYQLPTYASIDELFDRHDLDAAYVATPTRYHEPMAIQALERGIHVLCEKPMATTLESAQRMLAAAERSSCVLLEDHKRSVDRQVVTMWQLIQDGEIGELRSLTRWHANDWFYRPRAEDERDPSQGGVVLRQGAHEFDIIRLLAGSRPVSVRGWTGDFDDSRPGEGAYHAWVDFEDGKLAMSTFNGYDHFSSDELTYGLGKTDEVGARMRRSRALASGTDEGELKRRVPTFAGGQRQGERAFGFTVASGTDGDLRYAGDGDVWSYSEAGRRRYRIDGPAYTDFIVDEFARAISDGQTPIHDGRWGLSVLEMCLAVRVSAESGQPVALSHQHHVAPDTVRALIGQRQLEH